MSPRMQRPRRGRLAWVVLLLAAWTAPWEPSAFSLPLTARWLPGKQRTGALARHFFTQEVPLPSEEELDEREAEEAAAAVAGADAAVLDQVPGDESLAAVVDKVESFGLFVLVQRPGEDGSSRGLVPKSMIPVSQLPLVEHFAVGQGVSVHFKEDREKRPVYSMAGMTEEDPSDFQAVPKDLWLTGIVRNVEPYGMHVEVEHPESGRRASGLVHVTEISRVFIAQEELKQKYREGQEVRVRVKELEESRMSLSMLDEAMEQEVGEVETDLAAFRNISSEALLTGKVTKIFPYGMQVRVADPPGMGLVTTSEMLAHMLPAAANFKIGQDVSVRLAKIDEEKGLLGLSMEAKREDVDAFLAVPKDGWLRAFVYGMPKFGLLVDVEHPASGGFARGLVHISRVPGHMLPLAERCKEGQEVSVQVVKADKGQLTLSMEEREDVAAFLKVPRDQWLTAVINSVSSMGLHVLAKHPESGRSCQGLVHLSRMLQGDFQEGQEVDVRVQHVDVERKRIAFTMKELVDYAALAKAPKEEWYPGTVVRTLPGRGMLVDAEVAGQSITGMLRPELASRSLAQGKQLQVRIANVSLEEERVFFTSLEAPRAPEATLESTATKVAGVQDLAADARGLLQRYSDALSQQGYDSVASLKQLSREEWQEMKQACGLRPGHAAKLRAALHPDWA